VQDGQAAAGQQQRHQDHDQPVQMVAFHPLRLGDLERQAPVQGRVHQ